MLSVNAPITVEPATYSTPNPAERLPLQHASAGQYGSNPQQVDGAIARPD